MPGGRYDALRASIAKEPWDAAAWEGLVALSAASGSLDQQREILEELLSQFPTAVRLTALQASHAPLRYNTASRSVQLLEYESASCASHGLRSQPPCTTCMHRNSSTPLSLR